MTAISRSAAASAAATSAWLKLLSAPPRPAGGHDRGATPAAPASARSFHSHRSNVSRPVPPSASPPAPQAAWRRFLSLDSARARLSSKSSAAAGLLHTALCAGFGAHLGGGGGVGNAAEQMGAEVRVGGAVLAGGAVAQAVGEDGLEFVALAAGQGGGIVKQDRIDV